MLFKIFQYIGVSLIVLFCGLSIILTSKEHDQNSDRSLLGNYAPLFEDRFFDLRMRTNIDKNKKDQNIVIAAIDDDSLNKIGRWPWSRATQAKMVDKLSTFGAKILAFDVFYFEPELACNTVSPDITFAESIKRFQSTPGRKVILPYGVENRDVGNVDEKANYKDAPDSLLNFMIDTQQVVGANLNNKIVSKKAFPISVLENSDVGLSFIGENPDYDGVFRKNTLVANLDTNYFPSFALQTYQFFTNDKPKLIVNTPDSAVLKTKKGSIELNGNGEAKIRWLGGLDHFPVIPVIDIFNAKDADPEMTQHFKDKIVFVASTAFGAHDLRNSPVDSELPGIIFHANMVHMLLEGKFFVTDDESIKISWTFLFFGSILIIGVMFLDNAILDFFTVNAIIGIYLLLDTYYFIPRGYNLRLFFCIFSVAFCYSWSTFLHFYQSNKEKKKIKGTFSRYLAPSIVNDLLKNPDKVRLGGEKKNITVFFSDVRDFTSISEKLTPEQLTLCLNKYMTMMTDTLFEHKGTLDKYIGDAMVAYWGAPVELENHPYWAVKGAIAMIERLPSINEEFKKEGYPTFKHGIGLNTGECSVGNMGSNQIFSYTALGDNMNLGARLESLCKFYGVQLNISEYTKNAIDPELAKEFIFRTLDKVRVKGKEKALTIYEVLHPSHHLYNDPMSLSLYEQSFELYLSQKFNGAQVILQQLLVNYPEDKTFNRMHETCIKFIENPPAADWDGTFTHLSK